MGSEHRSSSDVQMEAEIEIFQEIEKKFPGVKLEQNRKIRLENNASTYIQPDFYSEQHCIVGEIFAHIGKPKKAQDNKIANDILKMLLLDKISKTKHRKIIAVCDKSEEEKLKGNSALAESIRQFGIEVMPIEISKELREKILKAQERQKMTNAE